MSTSLQRWISPMVLMDEEILTTGATLFSHFSKTRISITLSD